MKRAPLPFVVASVLGLAGLARAQAVDPPTDRAAAAQLLFEQGQALSDAHDFAAACGKFAESLKLDPGIGTMLWLADCYESVGRTASAWAQFKAASAAAERQNDAREEVARTRAAHLEEKLVHISIVVPSESRVDGLEVARDGAVLGSAEWGLSVPVDPGTHSVRASAPGRVAWEAGVAVGEGNDAVVVTVPALALATPLSHAVPVAVVAPAPQPDAPEARNRVLRATDLALAALGVAGLGVGTVGGLVAKEKNDDAAAHCRTALYCDRSGLSLQREAWSWATVANVGFGVGVPALLGGGALWIAVPSAHNTPVEVRRLGFSFTARTAVLEGEW